MKLILIGVCLFLSGCANIPFERSYSFGYGKASASVTLKPLPNTLYHEGKTIIPLHP